ncbi:hypothetical protein BDZ90DRAFT_231844 [Jaminaea rosea]|uniref:Uncharacterized protein n=1 Tax=Jaminaea rosea TaxID=1569628 RepID=A0A316USW2_9BASI|nr:hypothetical protein BDZ90DRAFT_231844 [Jaminaea rosea]PWN28084.1 hypothetical protein BDZ90DRAFT_231844 [Jaminaea rosea]
MPCALGLADSSMPPASGLAVLGRFAPLAVVPRREVLLLPPEATSTKLHLAQAVIAAKSSTEYGGGCGGPVSADACVAPGAVESTSAVAEPGVGDAPFLLGKGSAPLEVPATPPAEALPFLPPLDEPRPLLLLLAALRSPSNGVDSEASPPLVLPFAPLPRALRPGRQHRQYEKSSCAILWMGLLGLVPDVGRCGAGSPRGTAGRGPVQ